jgi:adenylate cyclase
MEPDRADESRRIWAELMETNPDYSREAHKGRLPFGEPEDAEKSTDGLHKACLPE